MQPKSFQNYPKNSVLAQIQILLISHFLKNQYANDQAQRREVN